jgi:predicted acylesterase/phospholipase RssA
LDDVRPLTPWLADKLDELAGINGNDPLTFGDLWKPLTGGSRRDLGDLPNAIMADLPSGVDETDDSPLVANSQRDINLRMVTSCLTLGHPFGLPFETRAFFFDPADMRTYFPERVVALMIRRSARPRSVRESIIFKSIPAPFLPFPAPEDMPVVVAARMSLSFPILLSAVPLYAIDWSLPDHIASNDKIRELARVGGESALAELSAITLSPEKCWFSDGGISSNFPIQFFDSPLPKWPTFGIDLDPFQPGVEPDPDQSKNVWMPERNDDGRADSWNRFAQESPRSRLAAFLAAIVDTMQNWVNNGQARLPGYRDRIAHVQLTDTEGGLNLNMPVETRRALIERGTAAGTMAAAHFAPNSKVETNWPNHRWVRYRSFTAMAQWITSKFHESLHAGTPSYNDLIASPPTFQVSSEQAVYLAKITSGLDSTGSDASAIPPEDSLDIGAPVPCPDLVVRPSL